MTDLLALSASDFEPHDGTVFRIANGDEAIEAMLIEVVARKGDTVKDAQRSPFAILFRVINGPEFEQQMVHMEHDVMGSLDLFLVPIGPDEEGMRYEATFS